MSRVHVYVRPGRTGLGNMLFPWARAIVFSEAHNIPMLSVRWTQPKVGPILRRERDARLYMGLFSSRGYVSGIRKWAALLTLPRVSEDDAGGTEGVLRARRGIVLFEGMGGMFAPLLAHHERVKARLEGMLTPSVREMIDPRGGGTEPYIAMHVRRGDMKTLLYGQPFPAGPGNFTMPVEWYVRVAEQLREGTWGSLPIRVFSDGTDAQLAPLLRLEGVSRAPPRPSIVDIFLMAKARLLVATSNSTFSMWATFLGRMPTVYYPGQTNNVTGDIRNVIETDLQGAMVPRSSSIFAL